MKKQTTAAVKNKFKNCDHGHSPKLNVLTFDTAIMIAILSNQYISLYITKLKTATTVAVCNTNTKFFSCVKKTTTTVKNKYIKS